MNKKNKILKLKNSQIKNVMMNLEDLGKQKQSKPQPSRKPEIEWTGVEVDELHKQIH